MFRLDGAVREVLGLCFVFVLMFNSLFRFNLMFLFIGFVIFGF